MSATGLESIDHAVQLTHSWINDLDERLGWKDKSQSYRLLRNVLHALRDWLQVNEAADFAAQFPSLLRGVYYEQWRPSTVPVKQRSKNDFIARINHGPAGNPVYYTPEMVSVVFRFLSSKIESGEIEDVRSALPADLRALWPATPKAA